jgi:saccharopine dehydrogenase-like NADP-dependent oxidoreductase
MAGARPDGRFSVLVLGATGVFGSRLCRLLADDQFVSLAIVARDRSKVEAMATALGVAGIAIDWRQDLDNLLAGGGYDALVHVAGPFRGQSYAVAEMCIRHRVHYLDLADDRAFVCGIDRLDEAARSAGVLASAGASTAPALTGAVVEAALAEGAKIERVAFGIVPGNDAPRGRALDGSVRLGLVRTLAPATHALSAAADRLRYWVQIAAACTSISTGRRDGRAGACWQKEATGRSCRSCL